MSTDLQETSAHLDRLSWWLWELTRHELRSSARFDDGEFRFHLTGVPLGCSPVPTGGYQLITRGAERDGQHAYRPGHPLAEFLIQRAASRKLDSATVVFDYSAHPTKLSLVEALRGHRGYLSLNRVSIESLEREDHLVFAAVDDSGTALDQETCERLFLVDGKASGIATVPPQIAGQLVGRFEAAKTVALAAVSDRNHHFFDEEIEELERWAEDLKRDWSRS